MATCCLFLCASSQSLHLLQALVCALLLSATANVG